MVRGFKGLGFSGLDLKSYWVKGLGFAFFFFSLGF